MPHCEMRLESKERLKTPDDRLDGKSHKLLRLRRLLLRIRSQESIVSRRMQTEQRSLRNSPAFPSDSKPSQCGSFTVVIGSRRSVARSARDTLRVSEIQR
jgi:hypothetical protein